MGKFKLKYVGWISALIMTGVGFTLTGCQNKAGTETQVDVSYDDEKDELQEVIADLQEQKKELQEEVSNLEDSKDGLQEEVSSLEETKGELQEEVSNLENSKDGLQEEVSSLEETKGQLQDQQVYNLEDLYFLDTSKIDPEQRRLYYILELEDRMMGAPGCGYDDNIHCCYAIHDGYDVPEEGSLCQTWVYKSIEAPSNILFYLTEHDFDSTTHLDPTVFRLTSNDFTYSMKILVEGDPHDTEYWVNYDEISKQMDDLFAPFKNFLNDEDIKLSYTGAELKDLSDRMNSNQYSFPKAKYKVKDRDFREVPSREDS